MAGKSALIFGIGGQDGAYLAKLLLEKGYAVTGTSRDASTADWSRLKSLGIRDQCTLISMSLNDFRSVLKTVSRCSPAEVYNLAGQTSVGLSFEQPVEAIESIAIGTLNVLEAIKYHSIAIKFYNAASSECFGDTNGLPANESTPFKPRSPYAVAKACAYNLVSNYREAYGLRACSGILFNHESPLRPERFVTRKIVSTASRIARGLEEQLVVGNIDIQRDWGWAPEYVEAMWAMLQAEQQDDYVIATGRTVSLRYFISRVFENFGLDMDRHLVTDGALLRPTEIMISAGDPRAAQKNLGWHTKYDVDSVIEKMCHAEKMAQLQ